MGFMAGFGSAFAQSFNQENQAIQQHQDDIFKMRYNDYVTQRDKRDTEDKANAKNMKAAAALAETYGQPSEAKWAIYDMLNSGVDQSIIAKRLDESQAVVSKDNVAKPGESATAADPRDNLTDAAASSVDSQMKASGMQTPASGGIFAGKDPAAGANRPASEDKGLLHNIFSSQARTSRATDRANADISAVTGKSQEEINSTIAGRPSANTDPVPGRPDVAIKWEPKGGGGKYHFDEEMQKVDTLNDATRFLERTKMYGSPSQIKNAENLYNEIVGNGAKQAHQAAMENGTGYQYARGFVKDGKGGFTGEQVQFIPGNATTPDKWVNGQGQEVDASTVLPVNQNMENDLENVAKEQTKPMQDYNDAKIMYKQTVRIASDAAKMAKENPEAMGLAGNVAQGVDMLRRAGLSVMTIANPTEGGNPDDKFIPSSSALKELDNAESYVQQQLKGGNGGVVDRVAQTALKATLLDIQTTRLAYLYAQQQGQSGHAISNKDFQAFKDSASGGGNPKALAQAAQKMLKDNHSKLVDLEKQITSGGQSMAYYKKKYGKNVPSGFELPSTIDQETAEDPELMKAIEDINKFGQPDEETQVNTKSQTPLPESVKKNHPEITQELWDQMILDGTDSLFTGVK